MLRERKGKKAEFAQPGKAKSRKKRTRAISEASTATTASDALSSWSVATHNTQSSKKPRKSRYDPEEESRLERLVFGDPSDVIENLKDDTESEVEPKPEIKDEASSIVDSSDNEKSDESDESDHEILSTAGSEQTPKAAAWKDEDDEDISIKEALLEQNRKLPDGRPERRYTELLQNKFSHIVGTPKWAKLNREKEEGSDDDDDDDVLKHSNHIVPKKSKSLAKDNIDIKVLSDVNKQTHIEGPFVNSVQFHESSTVALVAGSAGVVSLFEVDGRENTKLHSVQFEKFPIHTARFLKEGTEILAGSMSYAHCHSYDLITGKVLRIPLPHGITNMKKFEISPDGKIIAICGRLGELHFLSSKTKELIGTMKMNKKCRSLAFTPDSSKLIAHGESSEIYVWDVNSRTCTNRAFDDGCLSALSVAVSRNGQFIATGSKQGAVNIYETKAVLNESSPTPVKTILNLVTAVTKVKFNPTSEILAIASDKKPNAFKMVHIPSFHVFANFPTFNTRMFNPLDIDFSPASGYMSVSNNRGFAYLYRLKHYGNY